MPEGVVAMDLVVDFLATFGLKKGLCILAPELGLDDEAAKAPAVLQPERRAALRGAVGLDAAEAETPVLVELLRARRAAPALTVDVAEAAAPRGAAAPPEAAPAPAAPAAAAAPPPSPPRSPLSPLDEDLGDDDDDRLAPLSSSVQLRAAQESEIPNFERLRSRPFSTRFG